MSSLKLGDRGPLVEAWQKMLGVTADGIFGPVTENATRAWQARHSLTQTGELDSATVAAVSAESPTAPIFAAGALGGAPSGKTWLILGGGVLLLGVAWWYFKGRKK